MNVPKWAGLTPSRRLDFLLTLCQNSCYQSLVERLRDLQVTNPEYLEGVVLMRPKLRWRLYRNATFEPNP